jgi:hypothetical protein
MISLEERAQDEAKSYLEELLSEEARKLLQTAIENEVIEHLEAHRERRTDAGQRGIVRKRESSWPFIIEHSLWLENKHFRRLRGNTTAETWTLIFSRGLAATGVLLYGDEKPLTKKDMRMKTIVKFGLAALAMV